MSENEGIEKTTNAAILLNRFEKLQEFLNSSNSLLEAWGKVFSESSADEALNGKNPTAYSSLLGNLNELFERIQALEKEIQKGNRLSNRTKKASLEDLSALYASLKIDYLSTPFHIEPTLVRAVANSVHPTDRQEVQNFIVNNFYKDRSQIIRENILERLEQASLSLDGQFNQYIFSEAKAEEIRKEIAKMLGILNQVGEKSELIEKLQKFLEYLLKKFGAPEFFTVDKIEEDFVQAGLMAMKAERLLPENLQENFKKDVTEKLFKVVRFVGEKAMTATITIGVQHYLK